MRRLRIVIGELSEQQVQPNGIDLSLDTAWQLAEAGRLGVSDTDRHHPRREPVAFDAAGWLELQPGSYVVRYAEWVALPRDCAGLTFPRSSLLRMGVHVPTAVWDAGYTGRGEALLVVANPHGSRLQRGARIAQLVVFRLTRRTAGYTGRYQESPASPMPHSES